jgi:ribonuclease J
MAMETHKEIKIRPEDTVILSSKFIPGNERSIGYLVNSLYRQGAEVIYEKVSAIHVSGHAKQEELKLMINLVKPRYFIPIHGEYRHLVRHAQLAEKVGVPRENLIIAENGDCIVFRPDWAGKEGYVESGRVFVDGKGVGDVGDIVLRDRRHLAKDGMFVTVLVVDQHTGKILSGPDLISRGFVWEEYHASLLEEARQIIQEVVGSVDQGASTNWVDVEEVVRKTLKKYFSKTIDRRPLIFPIIIPM